MSCVTLSSVIQFSSTTLLAEPIILILNFVKNRQNVIRKINNKQQLQKKHKFSYQYTRTLTVATKQSDTSVADKETQS